MERKKKNPTENVTQSKLHPRRNFHLPLFLTTKGSGKKRKGNKFRCVSLDRFRSHEKGLQTKRLPKQRKGATSIHLTHYTTVENTRALAKSGPTPNSRPGLVSRSGYYLENFSTVSSIRRLLYANFSHLL